MNLSTRKRKASKQMDWGFDYYAPQSFLTPDGRRIMVGWANEWEWMPLWKYLQINTRIIIQTTYLQENGRIR